MLPFVCRLNSEIESDLPSWHSSVSDRLFDPGSLGGLNKFTVDSQWQVGRETNTFSTTRLAKGVAAVYKWLVKVWDVIYLWLDNISGGEETQRRELAEEARRLEVEGG
jgi:hypothetical protein